MEKYNVYKITNRTNGKFYVGVHKGLMDHYWGSGLAIKRAIEKYSIDNFDKEILHTFDNKEDAYLKESVLVDKDDPLSYNLKDGGFGGWDGVNGSGIDNHFYGKHHTKETKDSLSNMFKGISRSPDTEFKRGSKPHNTGKVWGDEVKQKISKSLTGYKHSDEVNMKKGVSGDLNVSKRPEVRKILSEQKMGDKNPMKKMKGKVIMINDGTITKYHSKELDIPSGWIKGRHK